MHLTQRQHHSSAKLCNIGKISGMWLVFTVWGSFQSIETYLEEKSAVKTGRSLDFRLNVGVSAGTAARNSPFSSGSLE